MENQQQGQQAVLDQWQRLILPPVHIAPKGGEQLDGENRYPDARVDLVAHLATRKTFAVNLAWEENGRSWTRCGVLDIDEGMPESAYTAERLLYIAKEHHLSVAMEHSGGKGCHVWIFSEPVAVEVMRAALKKLKASASFKGELIPLDNQRVKLAPGWHRNAGHWAYFLAPGEIPVTRKDKAPAEDFFSHQAAILSAIRPTPANVLFQYAGKSNQQTQSDGQDLVPDLAQLGHAQPPCIQALIERGPVAEMGSMDKVNMTLARYCKTAGLSQSMADGLAYQLADAPTPEGFTTKDREAKMRHWDSIQHTPAIERGGFSCGYMLAARKAMGFRCEGCKARPAGVRISSHRSTAVFGAQDQQQAAAPGTSAPSGPVEEPPFSPLVLEKLLADQLLALALNQGMPTAVISPAVFPYTPIEGDERLTYPLRGLIWRAIVENVNTPADMVSWMDKQPYTMLLGLPENSWAAKTSPQHQQHRRQIIREQAAVLLQRLREHAPIQENEARALVERAAELTAKRALDAAITRTHEQLLQPHQDVLGSIQKLHETTTLLQRGHRENFGAPLTNFAAELLEGLVSRDLPVIPTPFKYLNSMLAGGFMGGKLYVLGAPPGSGKTTVMTQMADYSASQHIPTAFIAFEMGRQQLFDYALARTGGINSAKVESRSFKRSEGDTERLAEVADEYLTNVAPWLTVIEGDYETTTAKLAAWVIQARMRYGLGDRDPVLIVVDYMQLMYSGDEKLDNQPNETLRISQVAVQLKQLARDTGAAVVALSDITKQEQGDAIKGAEFTLNAFRGSNRIGHAADVAFVLYSEQSQGDGGKAKSNPWDMLADKLEDNRRAVPFLRALETAKEKYPVGGDGAAVYSRLELIKNRGGQGKGSQLLVYERAYHRFQEVELEGQAAAEGRG